MKPSIPPTIQTALENTVGLKEGEKRWERVASKLGVSEGVLRNKVAPEKDGQLVEKRHHLSLAEAIAMIDVTSDQALIHAICKHFGGEFLHYPELKGASDNELLSRYTGMMQELGRFSNDIHKSLEDNKISHNEIVTLRKDFLRLSGALTGIMDRLQERALQDREMQKALV
jgi:hypothetical protein